ncbi:MAG TPA: nitrilase-related carbon-nitrogen hydrolase, partial [Bdellovibrionales bacterium]|nr:nitrilase-related carbon-nitrogen hydrolase [Bdellovibrionales bacterium]
NEYLSPEEKTRSGAEQIRLLIESDQKKLALLQKANKQHPESALFVFPENTFKDFFFQPLDEAQRINKSAADSAFGEIRKPLIYGGLYTTESGIANDLFFTRIENDRLQTVSFRKNRPMPFGEEIPGERWIPFLKDRSPISKMAPPSLAPIRGSLNGIMWGGFICNEAFYPELMASHRMAGARFAIGIGNEYTVRDTLGQDHLLAAAVVRAIESGIPIFKVSNYGGTFSIDAQGRVRDRLPNNQDGILFSELALASKEPTFFAKHPYWFHYVAAILIAFSAALITMKQWQNRTGTDQ